MKYRNANEVLPLDLVEQIQKYVQGEYVYIPIKDKAKAIFPTEYEIELKKRDEHIYTKSLEGISNKTLSDMYHLSESSIRRIINNQRKWYIEMEERIQKILHHWNIERGTMVQIYDSAWQIDEKYILKVYENNSMLERNIKITSILADMDIPVGKIVKTQEGETFAKDEYTYYILTEKLLGNNIVNVNDNQSVAIEMGRIIAKLHLAFKECEKQEEFWENNLLAELEGWICEVLKDNGWKYIEKESFDNTVVNLKELYHKLPICCKKSYRQCLM